MLDTVQQMLMADTTPEIVVPHQQPPMSAALQCHETLCRTVPTQSNICTRTDLGLEHLRALKSFLSGIGPALANAGPAGIAKIEQRRITNILLHALLLRTLVLLRGRAYVVSSSHHGNGGPRSVEARQHG